MTEKEITREWKKDRNKERYTNRYIINRERERDKDKKMDIKKRDIFIERET